MNLRQADSPQTKVSKESLLKIDGFIFHFVETKLRGSHSQTETIAMQNVSTLEQWKGFSKQSGRSVFKGERHRQNQNASISWRLYRKIIIQKSRPRSPWRLPPLGCQKTQCISNPSFVNGEQQDGWRRNHSKHWHFIMEERIVLNWQEIESISQKANPFHPFKILGNSNDSKNIIFVNRSISKYWLDDRSCFLINPRNILSCVPLQVDAINCFKTFTCN